jgi:hypothetical protein
MSATALWNPAAAIAISRNETNPQVARSIEPRNPDVARGDLAAEATPRFADGFDAQFCNGVAACAARFAGNRRAKGENPRGGCLHNDLRAKWN